MKPASPRSELTSAQRQAYEQERAYWVRVADSHFAEAELAFIQWHQTRLLECLQIPQETLAVEVGCGAGRLLRHQPRVLLVDFSHEILVKAREEQPHMWAVCASVDALPFRDASLRCLVANNMLHHVKGEGLLQPAVTELARVLHPEGRLFVNDRNPTLLHHLLILASNATKHLLKAIRGEFAGCGSFNEPVFLRRDWALLTASFMAVQTRTYYSIAMWALDSLAKLLAVLTRRPRSFVDRLQRWSLRWLLALERLPSFLHIERIVVYRLRRLNG